MLLKSLYGLSSARSCVQSSILYIANHYVHDIPNEEVKECLEQVCYYFVVEYIAV